MSAMAAIHSLSSSGSRVTGGSRVEESNVTRIEAADSLTTILAPIKTARLVTGCTLAVFSAWEKSGDKKKKPQPVLDYGFS